MKKGLGILILLLQTVFIFSQAPNAFKYQAIARDNDGVPISNQEVSIKIILTKNYIDGTPVYIEKHYVQTNNYGLINLNVGIGQIYYGDFETIDWSTGVYYILVEIDPAGGENYIEMGGSQLLSVPYALYAESTGNLMEYQAISLSNDTLYLSNGGYVFLGDYNNHGEIVELEDRITQDSIYLSNLIEQNTEQINDNSIQIYSDSTYFQNELNNLQSDVNEIENQIVNYDIYLTNIENQIYVDSLYFDSIANSQTELIVNNTNSIQILNSEILALNTTLSNMDDDSLYFQNQINTNTTSCNVNSMNIQSNSELIQNNAAQLGEVRMFAISIGGAVSLETLKERGWALCDGTTPFEQGITGAVVTQTPNLTGSFPRMSSNQLSGGTGGSNTHTHTVTMNYNSFDPGPNDRWIRAGSQTFDTGASSSLPPYYELVFCIKVK